MADLLDLTGRVAIVTGGGTGIGAATAALFAAHGADLVIASRTIADLEQVAASIEQDSGRRVLPIVTDVKDEDAVDRMTQRAHDEFGRIDILVNNAGGTRLGPLEHCRRRRGTRRSISTSAPRTSAPVPWAGTCSTPVAA